MQRIFNLGKWQELEDNKALHFTNPKPRVVRLEVNAANDANLYVLQDDGATFLARVCGRDLVEFWTSGAFGLCAQESGVHIYTPDGEDWAMENLDDRVFTVVREKRARDPNLEIIMAMMERNLNRRLEQQSHELRALFERREAARAALPPAPSASADAGEGESGAGAGRDDQPGGDGNEAPPRRARRSTPASE